MVLYKNCTNCTCWNPNLRIASGERMRFTAACHHSPHWVVVCTNYHKTAVDCLSWISRKLARNHLQLRHLNVGAEPTLILDWSGYQVPNVDRRNLPRHPYAFSDFSSIPIACCLRISFAIQGNWQVQTWGPKSEAARPKHSAPWFTGPGRPLHRRHANSCTKRLRT